RRRGNVRQIGAAALAAVVVSVVLYSSFFSNARGPLDSVLTFGNYFSRSSRANLHDKPWYYYLKLLAWTKAPGAPIWTEGLIVVLALAGAVDAFWRRNG